MEVEIFKIIEDALEQAGYIIIDDGKSDNFIVRHKYGNADYRISVTEFS